MGRAMTAPLEWLLQLDGPGVEALLREAGSLGVAAWHLARARCVTREHATTVPSAAEVRAAARELARRAGLGEAPSARALSRECEASGLLVI